MSMIIQAKVNRNIPANKKNVRNAEVFEELMKRVPLKRGAFREVADMFGISRERVRIIFRSEEVRRGLVFHVVVNRRKVNIFDYKKAGK